MEKSKLQIGSELVAINECVMRTTKVPALKIGKKYPIVDFTDDEDDPTEVAVVIMDEKNEEHLYPINELEDYFTF